MGLFISQLIPLPSDQEAREPLLLVAIKTARPGGAGGADHAMEAVRFMPGPPDNPWGAAATGLYQAEVPKDLVRLLAGSLAKNC